MKVCLNGSIRF